MAEYISPNIILHEGMHIPADPRNGDYRALLASGVQIAPYAPATVQKRQLTFAQLLIGLVAEGWISAAEGRSWLAGSLPAAVSAVIATLPENQRFAAEARALRPSVVLLGDPLVQALAQAQNKLNELPAFFNTYSSV